MWEPSEPLPEAIAQEVYDDLDSGGEEEESVPISMACNEDFDISYYSDIEVEVEIEELEPNPLDPSLRLEAADPDGYSSGDDADAPDEPQPHFRVVEFQHRRGRGGATRGGRAGRGRARAARSSGWSRGSPLQERFMDDADLPDDIRETVARLLAGHIRRNERKRDRRAVTEDTDNEDEEFFDAVQEFEWRSINDWAGVKETFLPESTGPTRDCSDVYKTFRCIWDDKILSHIVIETNRHAQEIQSSTFQKDWYPTNRDEIMILFAFWMMLGIIKMPTISSCFSKMPLLRTNAFRNLFTQNRYWVLSRAFQLANGSVDPSDPGNGLYPMGPVLDHLNEKFKSLYNLQQDICIDESLMLWKGPHQFRQYIKTKAAKPGIKTYHLCESTTGYLWSFFVYRGGQKNHPTVPESFSTVVKLMSHF